MQDIVAQARALCASKGNLVYMTVLGAHLYGTDSATSDRDYRGLYLPFPAPLLLGATAGSVQYTTAQTPKNTAADVDITLVSVQHWLAQLRQGDIGAMDVLFSMGAASGPLYDAVRVLEESALGDFIDITSYKTYKTYVCRQAKKYGLRGTRQGLLRGVVRWLAQDAGAQAVLARQGKAGELFDGLMATFYTPSLCFLKSSEGVEAPEARMWYFLGKGYAATMPARALVERLQADFARQGERVRQAEVNRGIDWKALSHAVRCLLQIEELADSGTVRYPLAAAPLLRQIKAGALPWAEVEDIIARLLAHTDSLVDALAARGAGVASLMQRHQQLVVRLYREQYGMVTPDSPPAPGGFA